MTLKGKVRESSGCGQANHPGPSVGRTRRGREVAQRADPPGSGGLAQRVAAGRGRAIRRSWKYERTRDTGAGYRIGSYERQYQTPGRRCNIKMPQTKLISFISSESSSGYGGGRPR